MDQSPIATRACVIHPSLASERRGRGPRSMRTPEARLEEAVGLAAAIDLNVVDSLVVPVHTARAATLFGSGKVEELNAHFRAAEAELVLVDGPLSPIQQRNLERAWQVKVLDRTGLILEIFGERAQTAEGRLQVELAQLQYQRSRLVRTWTHLERQRGGLGKMGGPGETQIESDRRMIRERIEKLERRLDTVRKGRTLQRQGRKKVPVPIIALVGYTNAGKSTLFNYLTSAGVLAQDMLFATLDPTMRALTLPSGRPAILSDTVGFISDLPTELVAAFRATLEEVLEADIILHVRDAAAPSTEAERADVVRVLKEMGVEEADPRVIEVLSKIDLMDEVARAHLIAQRDASGAPALAVSAITGEGMDTLLRALDERLGRSAQVCDICVPARDPAAAAWLHQNAEVLKAELTDSGDQTFLVRIDDNHLGRFKKRFGLEAHAHSGGGPPVAG